MIRAKFKCTSITEWEGGHKKYEFWAATSGDENKQWAAASPSGKMEITIANPNAQKFEAGKYYYLDFSPAE